MKIEVYTIEKVIRIIVLDDDIMDTINTTELKNLNISITWHTSIRYRNIEKIIRLLLNNKTILHNETIVKMLLEKMKHED